MEKSVIFILLAVLWYSAQKAKRSGRAFIWVTPYRVHAVGACEAHITIPVEGSVRTVQQLVCFWVSGFEGCFGSILPEIRATPNHTSIFHCSAFRRRNWTCDLRLHQNGFILGVRILRVEEWWDIVTECQGKWWFSAPLEVVKRCVDVALRDVI